MHRSSPPSTRLSWEREELRRSAHVAKVSEIRPIDCERYLNTTFDTAYPLEYAFYLLGDIQDKLVLDLGCGAGENLPILVKRGGRVIGLDVSPELVAIASERLRRHSTEATLKVASAYNTGLDTDSVDAIFCMAVLHHLDLARVRTEIQRILRPGGCLIVREPVRDSVVLSGLRKLIPERREDVSAFERPLKKADLAFLGGGLQRLSSARFRLPHIPVVQRLAPNLSGKAWQMDKWLLRNFAVLKRYATIEVIKFVKPHTDAATNPEKI